MPSRILVATDFSETSRRALDHGLLLARRLDCSLSLLHAFEPPAIAIPQTILPDGDLVTRLKTAATEAMSNLADSLGYPSDASVVLGYPPDAIVRTAKETGVELIVLGTHGHRGLTRALLGSVAEKVVRIADRPVLTVHRDTPLDYKGPLLVATDFSEQAARALDYGVALARSLHRDVMLLHANELPIYGFADAPLVSSASFAAELEAETTRELEALVADRKGRGVVLRSMARHGDAADTVAAVANELTASMIIVGTHGRRGVQRALMGSVAERLVRTAARPVLTVR